MMKKLSVLLVLMGMCVSRLHADDRADNLAAKVVEASGGDVWHRVKTLRFTFTVMEGNQMLVSARHVWEVKAGTDTVTWDNKTVTVNVWDPADDEDSKAAFQRWTNDSYWLIAPLKLMDKGVQREYAGKQDDTEVLRIRFDNVGLTPGDQYEFHIDPETYLPRSWIYMPTPEKKVAASWEEYQNIDGLKLSTFHVLGSKTILFERVDAELEQ